MADHSDPHDLSGRDASDAQLLERIAASDPHALEILMQQRTPSLLRLAVSITRSPETASEVVQDVYIGLWEQRTALRLHGTLGGYLWHATRNRALDAARRDHVAARTTETLTQAVLDTPRVAYNDADGALDAESMLADVEAKLATLPARCREIFLLRLKYQMSAEDIAVALGISLATTRNQLSRAIKHLSEQLGRK